jgi:uncharacterized membrane protein
MQEPEGFVDNFFKLPEVRRVAPGAPLNWLRAGWADMRGSLPASLLYGVLFALVGFVILRYAAPRPYLFSTLVSGFLLVGPLSAAGVYEISRRGAPTGFFESLAGLRAHRDSLIHAGILLALGFVAWERVSAVVFALSFQDQVPDLANFYADLFFSGRYVGFVVAYVVVGAVIAGLVFLATAVSIPMLMDRDTDIVTAIMTSGRSVVSNPAPMLLWAALLAAMAGIGFATFLLGFILLLPLAGHATWHAYRALVGD